MATTVHEVRNHEPGAATGLVWSDDHPLDPVAAAACPAEPGLIALVHGQVGRAERLVWAEAADDIGGRLLELLRVPHAQDAFLAWWLARGSLSFRVAVAPEGAQRRQALARALHEARLPSHPSPI
jgi:hypothetical protein